MVLSCSRTRIAFLSGYNPFRTHGVFTSSLLDFSQFFTYVMISIFLLQFSNYSGSIKWQDIRGTGSSIFHEEAYMVVIGYIRIRISIDCLNNSNKKNIYKINAYRTLWARAKSILHVGNIQPLWRLMLLVHDLGLSSAKCSIIISVMLDNIDPFTGMDKNSTPSTFLHVSNLWSSNSVIYARSLESSWAANCCWHIPR